MMKTRNLEIESYLFESESGQFRAIPFFELSIDEVVIYQNQQPKYLIDFNLKESTFIIQIKESMEKGFDLEEIIYDCGVYAGLNWTTEHNIEGREIPNSQQKENIQLEVIESFDDVANELAFIASENFAESELIDENTMFDKYLVEDKNGYYGLASKIIDRKENIEKLIEFIFQTKLELNPIRQSDNILIYDLSQLIGQNITTKELEEKYIDWIELTERHNTLDEYASMLGLIDFIDYKKNKKRLILRVEKKILCPTTYKNNGGDFTETNNNNKNKLWSKLKSFWS